MAERRILAAAADAAAAILAVCGGLSSEADGDVGVINGWVSPVL